MNNVRKSILLGAGIFLLSSGANAQILKNISKKIEKKAEQAVDKVLDNGNPSAQTSTSRPHQSSSGPFMDIPVMPYDFSAGSQIIFMDDFEEETIGAMASRWTSNGTGAVTTVDGFEGHWLKLYDKNTYKIKELVRIPENFTLEFDVLTLANNQDGLRINFGFDHEKGVGRYNPLGYRNPVNIEASYRFNRFTFTSNEVHPNKKSEIKANMSYFVNDVMKVKIRVQGDRMSAYIDKYKILDSEMIDPITKKYFYLAVENKENRGEVYLGNIKITAL